MARGSPPSTLRGREQMPGAGALLLSTLLLVSSIITLPTPFLGSGAASLLAHSAPPAQPTGLSPSTPGGGVVVVGTNDARAVNNTLLFSRLVLPTRAVLGTGELDIWLVEPMTGSWELGVGLSLVVVGGSLSVSAEWGSWDANGSSTVQVNRSLSVSTGMPVLLSIASQRSGEWSLSVNGASVPSVAGGLVDLGVSVGDDVPGGDASALPESVPSLVTTSTGPFPLAELSWTEAFGLASESSPVLPGDGYVEVSGDGWGALGEDQGSEVGPDQFNESSSLPALANGSYLWGIGNENFPPVAAWTSTSSAAFSSAGSALEIVVPPARLSSGLPIGLCQELLEPLDNGRWLTVGACWDDGIGVRAYAAVTWADGVAYQTAMYVSLPPSGQEAMIAVRDVGHGAWRASVNGQLFVDASGNSSIVAGTDQGNATMGPYGALRGYPATALPPVLMVPEGILVYPTVTDPTPLLPPDGGIADSDTGSPALLEGHLQDPLLPPGTIEVFPGETPLPFQTPLWSMVEPSPPSVISFAAFFSDAPLLLAVLLLLASVTAVGLLQVRRRDRPPEPPEVVEQNDASSGAAAPPANRELESARGPLGGS